MKLTGLNRQQVEESRKKYGPNTLTQIPPDPLWKKVLEGFKDPMIMILLVALAIQVVLLFMGQAEWYEPVGVLIAIMIANGVAAVSENKQEGKASALKAEEKLSEKRICAAAGNSSSPSQRVKRTSSPGRNSNSQQSPLAGICTAPMALQTASKTAGRNP